jgi:hypothetical protein
VLWAPEQTVFVETMISEMAAADWEVAEGGSSNSVFLCLWRGLTSLYKVRHRSFYLPGDDDDDDGTDGQGPHCLDAILYKPQDAILKVPCYASLSVVRLGQG